MKIEILISTLLLTVCANIPNELRKNERIVHGENADIHDFPYQASILHNGSHICGGSIIATNVILTSAYCTQGKNLKQFAVHVGEVNNSIVTSLGQLVKVKEIIENENYDSVSLNDDASLLILDSNLIFNEIVQAVPLTNVLPQNNKNAVVSGWGYTQEGGPKSTILQKIEVPVINRSYCNKYYYNNRIADHMFCAGFSNGYYDACQGDSGGPLVQNGFLIGIVSWGIGCARPGKPTVYTSVVYLREWIDKNLATLS